VRLPLLLHLAFAGADPCLCIEPNTDEHNVSNHQETHFSIVVVVDAVVDVVDVVVDAVVDAVVVFVDTAAVAVDTVALRE